MPGSLVDLLMAHALSEAPVIPPSEKQGIPDKAFMCFLTVSWL